MERLSIVIPNYNYGRFVGDAVRSALAVDWPDVDVVVVDDGSTDDSISVLLEFGDLITLIRQENAGPREACNQGFAATRGDAVIFLDSDDMLEPSIAREVASVWRENVSKVQVQMSRVDAQGRRSGRVFPGYRSAPSPAQIRYWLTLTSAYPTPPGSGNVYSRRFLEQLFPLNDRCGDATDSTCLAAAPFLGDVVTVPRPLARYRVHGDNRSSLLADPRRFGGQIRRAHQRQALACELAGASDERTIMRSLRRGRHLLQMRVAEHRVSFGGPSLPGDNLRRITLDVVTSAAAPGPEPIAQRLAIALWCLVVLVIPRPLARQMVAWRFA